MSYQPTETQTITVPNSLKNQLERAQNLLARSDEADRSGNTGLAVSSAREAMHVLQQLATQSPELTALLLAVHAGHSGYEVETLERRDVHQVVERKFFGVVIATDVVNVPSVTRTLRRVRIL